MQRCTKCKEEFSYKMIMASTWLSGTYKNIECPHCHTVHKIKRLSRLLVAVLITCPLLLNQIEFNFHFNIIGAYLIYIVLLSLVTPFIVRYKVETE